MYTLVNSYKLLNYMRLNVFAFALNKTVLFVFYSYNMILVQFF